MTLNKELNNNLIASAQNALDWMKNTMMFKPDGSYGIWERVRINMNQIVYWVRSDCCGEAAISFLYHSKIESDSQSRTIANNLMKTLLSQQTLRGAFIFYQYFSPDITAMDKNPNGGAGFWPNDNGKLLGLMCKYANEFPKLPIAQSAKDACRFFQATQNAEGWWNLNETDYPGTCFVAWPIFGLSYAYQLLGDEAIKNTALRALDYMDTLLLPSGRMKTSYEINKVENWRPVSSEAAEALLAYCTAQKCLGVDKSSQINQLIGFLERLTDESGAIHNCDETCMNASEQNNADLTDLVYTAGYALHAWIAAWETTARIECLTHARKLASFLASIQCANENPLWDGAWRGSYDIAKKAWDGRADQANELDEGGMYSVYTGWCSATITTGLLKTSQL
ncbi:hypothetical protein GX645_03660 [Candidatus Sumerlaeota bacterium]|nr:hypothetical protein [Candidatus Sumerlaeales bacterium]NLD61530.1 hypothetical protein [Candidatus Sumerlaeota bacterium]